MLEILTESEDTLEGRNRVTKILEEQRKTLKFAMSRPQESKFQKNVSITLT